MKKYTVIILALLVLVLACSCAPTQVPSVTPQATPTQAPPTQAPQRDSLLTFLAVSDTHIGDTNAVESMDRMLAYANTFEQKPEAYLFAGDLTDTTGSTKSKSQINTFRSVYEKYGTPEQMLYCLGPTHDVPSGAAAKEYRAIYRDAFGEQYFANDLQSKDIALQGVRHVKINGFHFFSVDWEGSNGGKLERNALKWLKDELALAADEDKQSPYLFLLTFPASWILS